MSRFGPSTHRRRRAPLRRAPLAGALTVLLTLAVVTCAQAASGAGGIDVGRLPAARVLAPRDTADFARIAAASRGSFHARLGSGSRFIGRLYGDYGTKNDYGCSASVVDSPNGSVVWTAAHCILSPDFHRRPPKALYFVPGLQPPSLGNPEPFGVWRGVAYALPKAFKQDGDRRAPYTDFAAVLIARNAQGLTISQALGGAERISFADRLPRRVTAFGYPAAKKFKGNQSLIGCGPAGVRRQDGMLRIGCGETAGASGGPWLTHIRSNGVGTVVSIFDLYNPHHPIWWGAPLGGLARHVWSRLATRTVR